MSAALCCAAQRCAVPCEKFISGVRAASSFRHIIALYTCGVTSPQKNVSGVSRLPVAVAQAETMETFQVLSLSLIEPGPAAGDAVTPGGIQSSTGTPATPPGSTSGGGAKADAPPGAAGDRPGGDSLAAGGEEFDDECMGCGRDDLLVRDVFYYGCKKEHYMCKDCARRRMEDDIAARNRPTCPVCFLRVFVAFRHIIIMQAAGLVLEGETHDGCERSSQFWRRFIARACAVCIGELRIQSECRRDLQPLRRIEGATAPVARSAGRYRFEGVPCWPGGIKFGHRLSRARLPGLHGKLAPVGACFNQGPVDNALRIQRLKALSYGFSTIDSR